MSSESKGPFYRAGLKFSCTRCSCCCRFDTGYVWLSQTDLDRPSARFDTDNKTVIANYCTIVDLSGFKRLSLQEQENKDCVFWQNGGCSVYVDRPIQCRSFPFWAPYLDSRSNWDSLDRTCPGVNIGNHYSEDEIDRWLADRQWEPPLDAEQLSGVGES